MPEAPKGELLTQAYNAFLHIFETSSGLTIKDKECFLDDLRERGLEEEELGTMCVIAAQAAGISPKVENLVMPWNEVTDG